MESPEKHQYNMATPPFLDKLPHFTLSLHFLAKFFLPQPSPPFRRILKKSNPPLRRGEGGGGGKGSTIGGEMFFSRFLKE